MFLTRASPSDAVEISALMHKLSHHFLAAPDGPETEAFLAATSPERMALYISEPSRVYVVAKEANCLVGFISLKDRSRISQFFVEPAYQGKGLGRRLWNEVRILAGAADNSEFTVDSSQYAVAVYQNLGFVQCGSLTQSAGVLYIPMRRTRKCIDA